MKRLFIITVISFVPFWDRDGSPGEVLMRNNITTSLQSACMAGIHRKNTGIRKSD